MLILANVCLLKVIFRGFVQFTIIFINKLFNIKNRPCLNNNNDKVKCIKIK